MLLLSGQGQSVTTGCSNMQGWTWREGLKPTGAPGGVRGRHPHLLESLPSLVLLLS